MKRWTEMEPTRVRRDAAQLSVRLLVDGPGWGSNFVSVRTQCPLTVYSVGIHDITAQ